MLILKLLLAFSTCSRISQGKVITNMVGIQDVKVFDNVRLSLPSSHGLDSCPSPEFPAHNSNITGSDRQVIECKDEPVQPNLTFFRTGDFPSENEALWRVSIMTDGELKSEPKMVCWNETDERWEMRDAVISTDKSRICCSSGTQLNGSICADLILYKQRDDRRPLWEYQESIETGHFFSLRYGSSFDHTGVSIKLTFRCGKYECSYWDKERKSGACRWRFDPDSQNKITNITVDVPYLTEEFEGASNCTLTLATRQDSAVIRSVIPISLTEFPSFVSNESDIGLFKISTFENRDPQCILDGWPAAKGKWKPYSKSTELEDDEKEAWKNQRWQGGGIKEEGNTFVCMNEEGTVKKWMQIIKMGSLSRWSKITYDRLKSDEENTYNCNLNKKFWIPRVSAWGYIDITGVNHTLPIVVGESIQEKGVVLNGTGEFSCWAVLTADWKKPKKFKQHSTLLVIHRIEVDMKYTTPPLEQAVVTEKAEDKSNTSLDDPGQENPVENLTEKNETDSSFNNENSGPDKGETKQNQARSPGESISGDGNKISLAYPAALALTVLLFILFTVFIYRVVRNSQSKVKNLLTLDKAQSNMGPNSLYAIVEMDDLGEGEPLLASMPVIPLESLTILNVLGTGQFGKVLKAILLQWGEDGEEEEIEVAVKSLKDSNSEEDGGIVQEFLREAAHMYQLDHPNILQLIGVCTDSEQYMIVSEFMEMGSLKDFLINRPEGFLTPIDKLSICYQVSHGLEYMTDQNIIHRDIAARNCLVGRDLVVKVADFGLSKGLLQSEYYRKIGGQVPIRWMSPEAIKFGRYTKQSDVWSFGVLMWEVYTEGQFPFSGYSNEEVQTMLEKGMKLHVPPNCTEDVSVLMQSCWESDPAKRLSFTQIRERLYHMQKRNSTHSAQLNCSSLEDFFGESCSTYSTRSQTEEIPGPASNQYTSSAVCQTRV